MRGYFESGQLSPSEKSDILDQHRTLYNGYQSMQPKVSNTQPLYVQDFAKDKNGVTMSNKGVVTHYTNFGINEQLQAAVGNALIEYVANKAADKIVDTVSNSFQEETNEGDGESQMCEECGGKMNEGICEECGSGSMEEETNEGDGESDDDDVVYEIHLDDKDEMMEDDEDMNVDDVKPAFDFESEGPGMGYSYPVTEEGREESFDDLINMDSEIESERDNLEQEGYERMESAFADEENEQEFRPNVDLKKSFEKFKGKKLNDDGIESFPMNRLKREKNMDNYDDLEDNELNVDFDKFDPREKSWEEITAHTGDDEFGGVDEDMVESLIIQKNRIMEMMNRMNVIK